MPCDPVACSDRGWLDRRGFLRLTVVWGAGLATAGCTGTSRSARAGQSDVEHPLSTQRVVISNHPLYIDADTNTGFTNATGTTVEYHEDIVDEDAWLAALTVPGTRLDRDVVILSDWAAARLTTTASVDWAQGMVGIAYDAKRVPEVHSIAELFQPPLHGRVALPNDRRITLGMGLLADHVDPSDPVAASVAQIDVTAGRLANSARLGQVLPIARSDGALPLDLLLHGVVDVAVVRASDVVGIPDADVRFVVPEEGGLLLSDVAVVPSTASNATAADAYLDYVSTPDHAARRYRSLPVMWPPGPVDAIMQRDAPNVVADPRRNPPPDVRARLHRFRLLDPAEEAALATSFDRVVHAAG